MPSICHHRELSSAGVKQDINTKHNWKKRGLQWGRLSFFSILGECKSWKCLRIGRALWGSTIHACPALMLFLRYQVWPLSGTQQQIWRNLGLTQYSHIHAPISHKSSLSNCSTPSSWMSSNSYINRFYYLVRRKIGRNVGKIADFII